MPVRSAEAFGLYVIEAGGRCPVVLPDHGSFPEIIETKEVTLQKMTQWSHALSTMLGIMSRQTICRAGQEAVHKIFQRSIG